MSIADVGKIRRHSWTMFSGLISNSMGINNTSFDIKAELKDLHRRIMENEEGPVKGKNANSTIFSSAYIVDWKDFICLLLSVILSSVA